MIQVLDGRGISHRMHMQSKTTQAVKTTPHNNQGKGATLVLSTVKLLHRKKRKGKSMGIKRFAGLA